MKTPRSVATVVFSTATTTLMDSTTAFQYPPHGSTGIRNRRIPQVTPSNLSNDESDNRVAETRDAKKQKKEAARTWSFEPVWSGSLNVPDIEPHTLILGTHPSVASLSQQQYYGHAMNAFWWIAGDCLGFRRDTAISPSKGEPYKFAGALRFGMDAIIPYDEQLRQFTSHGFALWDVVQSCRRPGSLDQDIRDEILNDIRTFCNEHSSIRRIVFANGSTQCSFFVKHFKEWLKSGELVACSHEASQRAFKKAIRAKKSKALARGKEPIELISAISVSPAAARYSYTEKRDFWEEYVYGHGLRDLDKTKHNRDLA